MKLNHLEYLNSMMRNDFLRIAFVELTIYVHSSLTKSNLNNIQKSIENVVGVSIVILPLTRARCL